MTTINIAPVCCPIGRVAPLYLGAMYFDHVTHVFYQARGFTAHDWRLVTPEEMVGSFVKVWRYFKGLPRDDPKGQAAREQALDEEAVRKTMAMAHVDVHRGERWTTAAGVDVMQARLTISRTAGQVLFVGFAPAPARPYSMSGGAGFGIWESGARFGPSEIVLPKGPIALRVEVEDGRAVGFVNDERIVAPILEAPSPREPVVSLFEFGDGPRPFEPGYELALKRSQERKDEHPPADDPTRGERGRVRDDREQRPDSPVAAVSIEAVRRGVVP